MAIAVLQGRVRSSRLPAKGFFTFHQEMLWQRMCRIAKAIEGVDLVYFCTGDIEGNEIIAPVIGEKDVYFQYGSENNVFSRFEKIARNHPNDYLVRITCDNYLVQPKLVSNLLQNVQNGNYDYGFVSPLSHYSGEIIHSRALINYANCSELTPFDVEHVTKGIRESLDTKTLKLSDCFFEIDHNNSVTLDNLQDFYIMKKIERRWPGTANINCLKTLQDINYKSFINEQIQIIS